MDNEKNVLDDSELEKVGGGYTVGNDEEICDQFEPIPYYHLQKYYCRHCVHYVKMPGVTAVGTCDAK